ncbi:MAG TPA: hypothetical protein DDW23_01615 [Planctomycetes bacterium]|nr:hypothetical protein [Planctomycetota bacterium]
MKVQSPAFSVAISLVAIVAALGLIGLVAGVSAAPPGEAWAKLGLHSLHLALGLAAFLAAFLIPLARLRALVPGLLLLVFGVLVLMLVSPSFGRVSHSAERWVQIGSFSLQPSAFLQFLWPVALASWAAKDPLRLVQPRELFRMLVAFFILLFPVVLQPDTGTLLILLIVSAITLFFAGAPIRYLRTLVLGVVALCGLLVFAFPHVQARMGEFFAGSGFQVGRAVEAFQLGGISGMGPGQGLMKNGWVPEGDTDLIFALIGEEWGLFGCLAVWALFVAFTVFGVLASRRADSRYGAILMAAATVTIALQAAYNMAMVTGAVPIKGLPLPFISRGGSSMLALSALLGAAIRAAIEPRRSRVPVSDLIPWTESNVMG